jgi:uncharacterized membrane protein/glutaredoxin
MATRSQKIFSSMMTGLFGLGLAFTLYLSALSTFTEAGLLCDLMGSDCLGAIHSAYGRVMGLSVASLGLGYFTFQMVLLAAVRVMQHTPGAAFLAKVQTLGATAAMGVSLFFVYVLQFVLDQGCVACYGVHAVNAAVLALCLVRHLGERETRSGFFPGFLPFRLELASALAIPLLLAANVTLAAGFLESKILIQGEQKKIRDNLDYYRYLHHSSTHHSFTVAQDDAVIGEPAIALHQIVLLHKDGCGHCRAAKEKLTEIVQRYDRAVYLVVREVSRMAPSELERLQVRQVPAVFVDGRFAEGWQVPGFLDAFTLDCGC